MHILLSALSALAAVGFLIWRINIAAQAAGELAEAGNNVRLFFRRMAWRRKANRDLSAAITDPREAAAAMMVAVAQQDGALTQGEITLIRQLMVRHFQIGSGKADELLARGRWLARDANHLPQFLRRYMPVIARCCTPDEQRELIAMLSQVAGINEDGGDVPYHSIAQLSRGLRIA